MAETSDCAWLISAEAAVWLDRAAADGRSALQTLDVLRRELSAERARLVVEQVDLRRRAAAKFGDLATRMFFTRTLLEQATDLWTARYKAQRLAAFGAASLCDYCCGAGGDLLALAERGPAVGWDQSDIACLLAEANLRGAAAVAIQRGDVEQCMPDEGEAWHLDPDRRPTGRRSTAVEKYSPGPALIDRWRQVHSRGAVKLAPAAEAPDSWHADAEIEWITHDRQCRQQVAWFSPIPAAAGRRRATLVRPNEAPATLIGMPSLPCEPAPQPGTFLYDPDPSVLAAGLLGQLATNHGLSSLGIGGSYLTSDHRVDDPLAVGFAVQDCLPLRTATLAAYLATRGIGRVAIKKRGVAVDPETLRKQLKLRGDRETTLVLTRLGKREAAIVAERLSP